MNATLVNPANITGRRRLYLWWCSKGHQNAGSDRECAKCQQSRIERHAVVHSSERTVIYKNFETGRVSVPGRADEPMHPKLAADGYERVELESWQQVKALEAHGLVHAQTSYNEAMAPVTVEKEIPLPKSAKELGLLD